MKIRAFGIMVLALWLAAPHVVQADDEEESEEASDSEGSEEGGDESAEGEEETEGEEGDGEANEAEGEGDKPEVAAPREWFFGPYLRYTMVPSFLLEAFLEESPTLGNVGFGIVADYQSADGGPTLEFGIGYTGFGFDGPMRASGDPEEDTEWVESDLALIHFTGSVLWDIPIMDMLSFQYGVGLDFGVLTGDLVRSEADAFDRKCPAFDPLVPSGGFCGRPVAGFTNGMQAETDAFDEEGEHYGVVEERVPPVGGNFMVPLALRFMPIEELAVKLQTGIGIPELFFIGVMVGYAPEL